MARIRDEQLAQDRRDQITAAAVEVFRRKGFHGARTEEICAAAGVSPGTLFRHFADKKEIIAAVVEAETQRYLALIEEGFGPQGLGAILARNTAALAAYLRRAQGQVSTETWIELARNWELQDLAVAADRRIRDALASSVRAAQAAGVVRASLDPAAAGEMLNAVFSGVLFDHELSPDRDAKQSAAALVDLLCRYLTDTATTTARRRR
jgi:AcrR family transcriptional regulator